ncbi:hypothetical protein IW261DRAFT_1453457 [Armillaria novae-zelandiae]|uniref:Uncharacterized protein n=1 Tax=Armillaria novae-zelandiae TaxID=153914 RepID=A0AA39UNI9_9AGAR|nr:hypothetical protein IW261DRAFT_1453457 [Armillaria novae-zelandiae]
MLAFRLHLLSTDAFRWLKSSHKYEYLNFHDFLHVDSLLHVFSTQYCFENRYALLSLLLVLCLLLFVSVSFISQRHSRTVVIPTRNRLQPIKNTVNCKEQAMEISLTALIGNIKSGDIEMRNPRADLSAIFRERLKVYGWTIGLNVEPMWSAKTVTWLLKGHSLYSKARIFNFLFKAPAPLLLIQCITSFIKSLAVGSTATIEFTIHFILCSLPLHTPTPTPRLFHRIESIVNISKRYADALSSSAERLVKDRADRIAFIDQYGPGYAALLDVGHVTRWIVELQK